jgi:hypothetical protein
MAKLIPKFLKELISPGNHLIIYFVILITSLIVGFGSAHFFKGNKRARIIESYAEKIIERETGLSINFEEIDDDISESSEMKLSEPMSNPFPDLGLPPSIP